VQKVSALAYQYPLPVANVKLTTLVNYLSSNAPSPSKSSSRHKISAKALAVEIWVLAHLLPNGRETQALLTWIESAAAIYAKQRLLHVQLTLLSQ